MVAILEIGAFCSSLVVGRVGDIIGRRKTILYGSIIFFFGGACQAFANGMPMMLVGRITAGLGVGMLSTIVPVYQSEISPPHNRGKLACIEFSGNITGYATSVWVDYFCSYIENDYSWRIPLVMQCVMGALLGVGSLLIVESPRFVSLAVASSECLELNISGGFWTMIMMKRGLWSLLTFTGGGTFTTLKHETSTEKSRWMCCYRDKKGRSPTKICSVATELVSLLQCLPKRLLSSTVLTSYLTMPLMFLNQQDGLDVRRF